MAYKTTAETAPYKTPPDSDANASGEADLNKDAQDDVGTAGNAKSAYKPSGCSYTPSSSINEHSYGQSGGKPAALGTVPGVVIGGAAEVAALPKLPGGNFSVGENKNVSEIV